MIYLDTSILVRLYINESGAELIEELVKQMEGQPACSSLGIIERASVFHRKVREGVISTADSHMLYEQCKLDDNSELIKWLPLTENILNTTVEIYKDLPKKIFLRAADAIHLATAREAGLKKIYSNDRHLLVAANKFDLIGINPLI